MTASPSNIIHTSEFSDRTSIIVFYAIIGVIGAPAALWYVFTSGDALDIIGGLIAFLFLLTIGVIMIWGELRKKGIRIYFKEKSLEVKPYLGFGKMQVYHYADIKGFMCGLQPALPSPYECITLVTTNKDLAVAQFYFRNYAEMKAFVTETFEDLGINKFSIAKELKAIFRD